MGEIAAVLGQLDRGALATLVLAVSHGRSDEAIGDLLLLRPLEVEARRVAALCRVARAVGADSVPVEPLRAALSEVGPRAFGPPATARSSASRDPATGGSAHRAPEAPRHPQLRRAHGPPRARRIGLTVPLLVLTGLTGVAAASVAALPGAASSGRRGSSGASPPATPERASAPASSYAAAARRPTRNVYAFTKGPRVAPRLRSIRPRVYVPETARGIVDVIDPRRFRIVRRFRAGAESHHVTPAWNLAHLFVDNTAGNSLTVIGPQRGRPVRTLHVRDPYNLYFTPDGRKAIVVAERHNRLDFRSPRTWRLIRSVRIPGSGADHLDFSADGSYLLVSTEYDGHVVKVATRTMRVIGRLRVGGLPVDVKLASDGRVFYVANQGRGGVSVVAPRPLREVRFLRTGRGAHGLYISRDTRSLYVSNRLAGTISVIDLATRRVRRTWRVGGSPDMIQLSPDGRQLWVSNRFDASVSVIDTRTGRVLHRIRTGTGPHGLSYFPEPGRYSVGHNGVYR